jgi:hypothetical protein
MDDIEPSEQQGNKRPAARKVLFDREMSNTECSMNNQIVRDVQMIADNEEESFVRIVQLLTENSVEKVAKTLRKSMATSFKSSTLRCLNKMMT